MTRIRAKARDWVLAFRSRALAPIGGLAPEPLGVRTLFDNFIGRKRDVGGGFLAGQRCGLDYDVSCVGVMTMSEEIADGHVSKFIALEPMGFRGTSRDGLLGLGLSGCVWNSSRIRFGLQGLSRSDQSG